MRLPKRFTDELPKGYMNKILLTEGEFDGEKCRVAVAVDVFRILLHIETGGDVCMEEIDYHRIFSNDNGQFTTHEDFKGVINRALELVDGFQDTHDGITLEELFTTEGCTVINLETGVEHVYS